MIDKTDEKILQLLHEDASLSTYQIAKKTLIPQTTVFNRIRKLKAKGVIKRFTIEIDHRELGKKDSALIFVKVNKETEKGKYGKIGNIENILFKHPLVQSIKRLMGKWDFVIEIISEDVQELNEFLITEVRSLDMVADTETIVVLKEWKR